MSVVVQAFLFMLTRIQKQKVVEELADKIKRQKSLIFTDVGGVNVVELQDLRRKLKKAEIEYKVAKKSLIDLALKKDPIRQNLSNGVNISQFTGTIGLAISYSDPISSIKILDNFSKEHKHLKILGGIIEDRALTIEGIKELAKIPSKDELLAKLVGSIKGPISGFVNVLGGNIRNLVAILNGIISK